MKYIDKLKKILNSREQRAAIYNFVHSNFKLQGGYCAATQSQLEVHLGTMQGLSINTAGLLKRLLARSYAIIGEMKQKKVLTTAPPLKYGDICFSLDLKDKPMPDHTFRFLRWLDEAHLIAEVWDNYSIDPTPRNLGAPCTWNKKRLAKTAFAFALRHPEAA